MAGIYFDSKEDKVGFGDMLPLQEGEVRTRALLKTAWDMGQQFSVTQSIARWGEQSLTNMGVGDAFKDLYSTPNLEKLDPKVANERYGIPGQLSFSSPIRESVAQILRERKDEELARQFILDKAQGLQNVGVFGANILAGVLDPAAIMAGFVPIVPEATYLAWTQRSLIGGRAAAGAIEGAVGNAMVEPIIFGQAMNEQAIYGPFDSFINIVAGGVFGSGFHVVGGKFTDWLHGVQMKAHLKALQTAINQASAGKKIEVEPILGADATDTPATVINFDEPDPHAAGERAVAESIIMEGDTFHSSLTTRDASSLPDQQIEVNGDIVLPEMITIKGSKDPTTGKPYKIIPALKTQSGDLILYHAGQPLDSSYPDVTWFTAVKDQAVHYAEIMNGKIQKVTVTVKNALDLSLPSWNKKLLKILKDAGIAYKKEESWYVTANSVKIHDEKNPSYDYMHITDLFYDPEVKAAVQKAGYDAVIFLEGYEEAEDIWMQTFVILDAKQIHTADSPPKQTSAPLTGDTTDGIEIFAAANHIEALNGDNLVSEGTGQLGSIPGEVVTDKATGKKYYAKYPTPDKVEQARQEFIAYAFYKMGGLDLPEVRPIIEDGHFVGVASEWQDGATKFGMSDYAPMFKALDEYRQKNPQGFEKFVRGIIFHMWLSNWDWASPNNIIITADGVPMFIDYGATLQYRATGIKKTEFSENVIEFKGYADPQSVATAQQHFQRMHDFIAWIGNDELWQRGVNDLAMITDDDISSAVWRMGLSADDAADIASTLIARRIAILEKYSSLVDPTVLKSAEFFDAAAASKFVEDNAPHWKPLSQKASDSLTNYKGSGYDDLNAWLRGAKKFSAAVIQSLEKMKARMDDAVQGFFFQQEAYIWRGGVPLSAFKSLGVHIGDDVATVRKKLLGSGIGHVIADPAFISTTTSKSFAINWKGGDQNKVVLRIKVPKGQPAAIPLGNKMKQYGGASDGEMEFVLPRDTKMVITDVYKDKHSGSTIVNTKIVPSGKVKPIKPELAMKMAEKHIDDFSSVADETLLDAELTYSLKEAMNIKETDELIPEIDKESNELLKDILDSSPMERDSLEKMVEQLTEQYDTMRKQSNAMAKGAMAAYGCVLKNANL